MKRLKFYGLGGQGVVTAGKTLSTAVSIHEGKYAITVPAYGHERRGAPVFTDVVVDEEPVLVNCFVYEPDIVVVMDDTIREKNVDVSKGMHTDTVLIINTADEEKAKEYKRQYNFKTVYYVNATQVALDHIGRGIPNNSMLGALANTGVVSIESVESAVREIFGERAGESNANSAREAYNSTQEI